ncbi:Lipoprotein OS=Streptomyces tendae OX=1932 GN=F3L20_07610 PE=4 SV=1 [Streptomyces tendae]
MSLSPSPRPPLGPRRRSLLGSAAGAALLVGCTGGSGSGGAGAGPSAVERARARAARDSEELAARYAAVIAAHPRLAERLGALREEVVRHAEAFGGGRAGSPSASASGTGVASTASPSVSARAAGPADDSGAVPDDEKGAVDLLVRAERKLADRRARALLDVPGELARLLASVSAAGAAHVFLLTEG